MKKKSLIIGIVMLIILFIVGISIYFVVQKNNEEKRNYEIAKITDYKYFVLKENNKYGVIDREGNTIIEAKYDSIKITNPEKAVFICYEEELVKVLNESSEEIFTEYESIEPLKLKNVSGDLMYEKTTLKYSENGKYGIIDLYGNRLTDAIYEEIDTLQFKEGELLVKINDKYGIININGVTLVKAEYDKIESDKYYQEDDGYKSSGYIVSEITDEGYRYGYVNLNGKEIIETLYNELYRIVDVTSKDVYIIAAENGKYGLLKNGEKIIETEKIWSIFIGWNKYNTI